MRRILFIFVALIMMMSLVSASEFDNIKSEISYTKGESILIGDTNVNYNKIWDTYSPIEIRDNFGFSRLFEGAITQHTEKCGTNDCKSELQISIAEAGVLIEDIRFYTLRTDGSRILQPIKRYDLFVKTGSHTVQVNNYETVCNDYGAYANGSRIQSCYVAKTGTHSEEVYDYAPYTLGDSVPAGDYYIKLTGEKKYDRSVDWQIKTQGKWIEEWSAWDSGVVRIENLSLETNSGADGAFKGVQITPNFATVTLLNVTLYPSDTSTLCNITDNSNAVLATAAVSGTHANFGYNLTQGVTYRVVCGSVGATMGYNSAAFTGSNQTNLKFLNNIYDGAVDNGNTRTLWKITSRSSGGSVTVSSPANLSYFSPFIPLVCNASIAGSGANITNISLWTNTTGVFALNQTKLVSGQTNASSFYLNLTNGQNMLWTCQGGDDAGDTGIASENRTSYFNANAPLVNSEVYNLSSYESSIENFYIAASGMTSASLFYNNTILAATVSGNSASKTVNIPNIVTSTNKSWYWILNGGIFNTTATNQTISAITLGLCNATNNKNYINFTFKNETTIQQNISASIVSAWTYYIDVAALNRTLSYSNTPENASYSFCFTPAHRPIKAIPVIQYYNTESAQRSYQPGTLSISNITTNQTLFLLPTSLVSSVSFQVVTIARQTIPGALVSISLPGVGVVEQKITDGSGIASFLLNPFSTYTITTSATGFADDVTSITPTQSSYTITLGSTSSAPTTFDAGVNYYIQPTGNYLINDTTYNFNFSITSSLATISEFGFSLTDGNYTIKSINTTSSSGSVSISLSTGINKTFVMLPYYIINGSRTDVSQHLWNIQTTTGQEFSLKNLLTDLRSFSSPNGGIFGLTGFGLNIIVFIIILFITGVVSYQSGLVSPAAISAVLFGLVFFFDVVVDMIDDVNGIPFATIFVAIIFISLLIKENSQ